MAENPNLGKCFAGRFGALGEYGNTTKVAGGRQHIVFIDGGPISLTEKAADKVAVDTSVYSKAAKGVEKGYAAMQLEFQKNKAGNFVPVSIPATLKSVEEREAIKVIAQALDDCQNAEGRKKPSIRTHLKFSDGGV